MAKKQQKYRKYTDEEREIITQEYFDGKNQRYLFEKYGVSQGTLKTWKRKHKRDGHTIPNKKGRPKLSHLTELEKLRLENDILKKFQAFLKAQLEEK